MHSTCIEVKGLRKSFGKLDVLKGVDFTVQQGEVFALLGPNGAGKTTLVRILSTLLALDNGSATVCGFDVAKQPWQIKNAISLTGQFTAVDEVLTGRENLVLIAKLRHVEKPREVTADLLERFALTHAADRSVGTYSGGMRRRLDIAMSLIGNPRVIFLDEPTTGLDPKARSDVWNEVRSLANKGITIFLATQYLEEAEHLANRIAILNEGRIVANGTPDELKGLLPPATVEYVKKQPSLEEVFLAITTAKKES